MAKKTIAYGHSIGITAAKKRTSTYFIKCHDLIQNLKRERMENRLEIRSKHYTKYRLLIIDEIGYLPIDPEEAKLFFQLIVARYEKKSTIFTTNVNFKSWDEIFPESNSQIYRVMRGYVSNKPYLHPNRSSPIDEKLKPAHP